MANPLTNLTAADLADMRRLWETEPDIGAAAIGAMFGVTKNVVIGRAHRGRWGSPERSALSRKPPATVGTLTARLAALDVFPPTGGCIFPIGHPRDADFRFCGDSVPAVGEPYCQTHRAKCWIPDKSSQRGAR